MKSRDFSKKGLAKLAVLGLATGLMLSNSVDAASIKFDSQNELNQQMARGGCPNACGGRPNDKHGNGNGNGDIGMNGRTRRHNPNQTYTNDPNSSWHNHKDNGNENGHENGHDNGNVSIWHNQNGNGNGNGHGNGNGNDKASCGGPGGCGGISL